nr:histone deacetylase complex subunit SAP30/SAP30-like protein [Tanacetum cinerariifolium]
LKKTVKAVARFLDRVNRALGTCQKGWECFTAEDGGGKVFRDIHCRGGDGRVLEKQHGVNIMALAIQIGMALDVVGEEVVGSGGAEMVVNVLKNGIEVKLQRNALSVLEPPTGLEEDDEYEFEISDSESDVNDF